MHKLKLELLQVDSFETTAVAPHLRGTVLGRAPLTEGCSVVCEQTWPTTVDDHTRNFRDCGHTNPEFDCTYQCTVLCTDYSCKVELCNADLPTEVSDL